MLKCDFLGNMGAQFKQLSENSDGFGLGGLLHSPRISQNIDPQKSPIFPEILAILLDFASETSENPPKTCGKTAAAKSAGKSPQGEQPFGEIICRAPQSATAHQEGNWRNPRPSISLADQFIVGGL